MCSNLGYSVILCSELQRGWCWVWETLKPFSKRSLRLFLKRSLNLAYHFSMSVSVSIDSSLHFNVILMLITGDPIGVSIVPIEPEWSCELYKTSPLAVLVASLCTGAAQNRVQDFELDTPQWCLTPERIASVNWWVTTVNCLLRATYKTAWYVLVKKTVYNDTSLHHHNTRLFRIPTNLRLKIKKKK